MGWQNVSRAGALCRRRDERRRLKSLIFDASCASARAVYPGFGVPVLLKRLDLLFDLLFAVAGCEEDVVGVLELLFPFVAPEVPVGGIVFLIFPEGCFASSSLASARVSSTATLYSSRPSP